MSGLCQSRKYSAPSGPISASTGRKFSSADWRIGSDLGRFQPGAVLAQLVVEEAAEADGVEHDHVALHRLGEVAARDELGAADRARAHRARLRRILRLHRRVVLLGRERRSVVRLAAGRIEHDVASPLIEHVAMRVREVHRDVDLDLPRSRLVAEHAAVRLAHRRRPRRLDLGAVEDPLLHVERTTRIEGEAVDRVMRVGGVEAVQQVFLDVVLVVAVRVLQEHEVRRLRDEHAVVVELEAGRDCSGRRQTRSACPPCRRRRCLRGSAACRLSRPWAASAGSSSTPPPRAGPWCRTPSARD